MVVHTSTKLFKTESALCPHAIQIYAFVVFYCLWFSLFYLYLAVTVLCIIKHFVILNDLVCNSVKLSLVDLSSVHLRSCRNLVSGVFIIFLSTLHLSSLNSLCWAIFAYFFPHQAQNIAVSCFKCTKAIIHWTLMSWWKIPIYLKDTKMWHSSPKVLTSVWVNFSTISNCQETQFNSFSCLLFHQQFFLIFRALK